MGRLWQAGSWLFVLCGVVAGCWACGGASPAPATEPAPTPSPVVPIVEEAPSPPPLFDEDVEDDEDDDDLFTWKRPEEAARPAPQGQLPQVCEDYFAMLMKCMATDQFPPEALAALKQAMETSRAAMGSATTAEAQAALSEGCRDAREEITKSQACGGSSP